MSVRATVLIPTHDHGPLLRYSVGSALRQTVEDLEVLVVGDGVPDETRELMLDMQRQDDRVGFFDNPKGPRHGELLRHAALQEARGAIVCYLSDDDLFLPEHVETAEELLAGADFAHTLPFKIGPDGSFGVWTVDLALAYYRKLHLGGQNRIPLSCAAHTLAMYRRLPYGWRTTPPGIYTDLYMWQQLLADPSCRVSSGTRPTMLHFPSPDRTTWTIAERMEELDRWAARLGDPALTRDLSFGLVEAMARDHASALAEVEGSVTRRARERALRIPVVRGLLRTAARALGGRAAR